MYGKKSVTTITMKSFPGVKMIEQYSVLGKRINLSFSNHKLASEIDEKGHSCRYEKKKKEKIK